MEEKDSFDVSWVVGAAYFNNELNLDNLRDHVDDKNWEDAKSQPGVRVRLWNDESQFATFFETGKCILGATDEDQIRVDMKEDIEDLLKEMKLIKENEEVDISINNVVARANAGQVLDLPALQPHLGYEKTEYEPEQFPALVYQLCCTVLIFSSGKVILTGANKTEQNKKAFSELKDKLKEFEEITSDTPWN
jgi:transcription initiation factor TFIID TATA-box-binding protein